MLPVLSDFFAALSSMLSSSPEIAIAGSFLWGVAGIILSPCHLAGIPLIVGYIGSQGVMRTARAALIAALFSAGILITIAVIGAVTGLAGRMMGDIGRYGNTVVAVLMVIIGLYLLGVIPVPFLENGINQPGMKRKGLPGAFLLGLFFGLALGPCTFAYMAPMLGVAFTVASSDFTYAAALVGAYALGHCMVIIIAGTFSEFVQHLLKWNEESKGALYLKKGCGILVVSAGIYMMVNALR
ncbi:MAG TPA: cytochrome c biogenesis protein CcdA [Spirochaetota bacterium]|nr:cytochrome c biogenesis protein CcdA [Spirochaetota bacterium]